VTLQRYRQTTPKSKRATDKIRSIKKAKKGQFSPYVDLGEFFSPTQLGISKKPVTVD